MWCVATVGHEKHWDFTQSVIPQLRMAMQHLLWLHRPSSEIQSRLQRINVKKLTSAFAFFPSVEHASPQRKASVSLLAQVLCKSGVHRKHFLATSSHLLLSLSISFMSLLQTSLMRRFVRLLLSCWWPFPHTEGHTVGEKIIGWVIGHGWELRHRLSGRTNWCQISFQVAKMKSAVASILAEVIVSVTATLHARLAQIVFL